MSVRGVRSGLVATAAVTTAMAAFVFATLPPPALRLDGSLPVHQAAGAYHVHSTRSDGTGTPEEIAEAASRAGLQFVILTDHGDGTRTPDEPAYHQGVLIIDALEVNTREGHVVALGLEQASPYPLAGLADDVIADIRRQGGMAIIAHPDSPRSELSWRGAPGLAGDGVEWLNADSEWRDESTWKLVQAVAHAVVRPSEAIGSLFTRPVRTLQRWDGASRVRPAVGLAAVDAHANIPWREQEEPRRSTGLSWPSYESLFRTLVQTVVLDQPLSGEAVADARAVIAAIAGGRTYSTLRSQAWPSVLEFTAERGGEVFAMGERLPASAEAVTFSVRLPNAPGAHITLVRNGLPYRSGQGTLTVPAVTTPGVYRVEVSLPAQSTPWLVSNPIVLEGPDTGDAAGAGRGGRGRGAGEGGPNTGTIEPVGVALDDPAWTIERDALSEGEFELDGARMRFAYALGGGAPRGQYAALVYTPGRDEGLETVSFVAAAAEPMRLSIQVRLPEGRGRSAQRWRRSVFIDRTPARYTLRLQDFEPADRPTQRRPIVTPIQSLLFVADTVNSHPGSSGIVWLSELSLGVNRLE